MKKSFLLTFLVIAFLPTLLQGQDLLRVSGQNIVDSNGEPCILKGMGLGGWMLQEGYMLHISV